MAPQEEEEHNTNGSTKRRERNPEDTDPDGTQAVAWEERYAPPSSEEPQGAPVAPKEAAVVETKNRKTNEKRRRPRDKRTEARLVALERKRQRSRLDVEQATELLQDAPGYLQAETPLERTSSVTQAQLMRMLPKEETKRHRFDLQLPNDSYRMSYDRSGHHALLAGRKGHVAMVHLQDLAVTTELHVQPKRIRDAIFLHDATMAAVAQADCLTIYDNTGAEIHTLDQHHKDPVSLAFLPYHWLLVAACGSKHLSRLLYTDTSTGQLVAHWRHHMGKITTIRQNPANAVIHAGQSNGCVSLWSPAHSKPLAKMLCHKGAAITDIVLHKEHTMATGGMDGRVRIWDLRMYKEQFSYTVRGGLPHSLDISQTGLLAVGHGSHVTVWPTLHTHQKHVSPYLHHLLGPGHDNPGVPPVNTVRFCPYADALGVGHAAGVSSLVVPGAGEATRDTLEVATDKQQVREATVRSLLEKLPPELIGLDTKERVGAVEVGDDRFARLRDLEDTANGQRQPGKQKQKKRGRSKIQTQLRRKQQNVIGANLLKLRQAQAEEEEEAKQEEGGGAEAKQPDPKEVAPPALRRFF